MCYNSIFNLCVTLIFFFANQQTRVTILRITFKAKFGAILDKSMYDGTHLVSAALGEVSVISIGAGSGASVHNKVASFVGARRTVAVVRIVLGAKVVADLVGKSYLRDGLGHSRLIVDHRHNAAIQAFGHALQRLPPLAHAAHATR